MEGIDWERKNVREPQMSNIGDSSRGKGIREKERIRRQQTVYKRRKNRKKTEPV